MPNFDAFYDRLRTADRLPTTSQPSIGDFLEVYEPLVDQGLEVVSVHISGGISGTVESPARPRSSSPTARASTASPSSTRRRAAGGMGLVVLAGARAAQAGAIGGGGRGAHRGTHASDLKMWFAVDTLEYLRRGGRIGAASAWLGSALKIKPILTLEQEITPIERVRTGAKALRRLVEYAEQRHADGADAWVVQHIQAPDEAAPAWSRRSSRSWVARRCSCPRSGRCSARTSGRGCWASAACRRADRGVSALAACGGANAAKPPPTTNPSTAAPAIAAVRCSLIWRRQSVSTLTLMRSSSTDVASSRRVRSIECWISSGRAGGHGYFLTSSAGATRSPVLGARSPPSCASPPRSPCRASAARRPGSSCRR